MRLARLQATEVCWRITLYVLLVVATVLALPVLVVCVPIVVCFIALGRSRARIREEQASLQSAPVLIYPRGDSNGR